MLDSDAQSAKTLTLVALLLQAVFFAIGILTVLGFAFFAATSPGVTTTGPGGQTTTLTTAPSGFLALFGIVFGGIFLVGLIWILLDYFLIYKRLSEGNVRGAETPSLVLGIIQLIFGGVITGILLIIAYVKIGDSIRRNQQQQQDSFP